MTTSLSGLLIGALAFAVAFGIAKFISVRRQRQRKDQSVRADLASQSRQVRRARERRGGR